jgi:hypothetical protein
VLSTGFRLWITFWGWITDYQRLQRLVQKTCVETCNDNGWVIPFTQVTLHMAPSSDPASERAPGQPDEVIAPPRTS